MRRSSVLAILPFVLAPTFAEAQENPAPAVSLSGRLGYEVEFDALALGAQVRVPLPLIPITLQGVGDFTFLSGITERQLALDALWRAGIGVSLGGGPVFRNTVYGAEGSPRETRTGYSIVLALGGGAGGRRRMVTGIELRWIWVEDFRPQTIMVQVGVPLFRW